MVEKIKQSLAKEEEMRKSGARRGFAASLQALSIMQNNVEKKEFDFSKVGKEAKSLIKQMPGSEEVPCKVSSGDNCFEVVPETMEGMDSDDDADADDLEITAEKTRAEVLNEKVTEHIDLDDSEEEETVTLTTV